MTNEHTTQTTLNAWQAQLEQVRQRRIDRGAGHAGLAHPDQVRGKTGLQVMTALLEGDLPHPYMADTFDCELVELGDGHAVFQATPQLKHYNPLGSVHGGWYATLLDFALGCAVQTQLPVGRSYTTSQINLNIVRAASTKTGPLRCVGFALHVGRQVGTAEARIVGPDGKLYAHATTTCAIFETPPAAT
ncbi:MAG: PaaI family thioesterase [Burkholderiales bacterium]|nr:PaaI family thioesterase [Burkholderiales bacterium]